MENLNKLLRVFTMPMAFLALVSLVATLARFAASRKTQKRLLENTDPGMLRDRRRTFEEETQPGRDVA
jgi:hypothetical protein